MFIGGVMAHLKLVPKNAQSNGRNKTKEEYILYSLCTLYFTVSGIYFFSPIGSLYSDIASQSEVLVSFLIGAVCTRLGKNSRKIMYGFCGYSVYVIIVDNIFPTPTSLQWFLEVVLFFAFVYYISIAEKL